MDKNTNETYEFLPANNTEPEADQFFIVHDDGTFLINRQIQYVAQVQDVKETLEDVQPCNVYDVSAQQFFVDVDNSTELISVSDQFVLPNGEDNLYGNGYLLQPGTSTNDEQMEEDVVIDQFKQANSQEVNIDEFTQDNKQTNNCTEITLSDEQYKMLEQKGWILLESNEKIFVLNTLGLHDITTNDKLVQKLKSEIQESTNVINSGCLKIENVSSPLPLITHGLAHQEDAFELVIGNENITKNELPFIVDEKVEETSQQILYEDQNEEIPTYAMLNEMPKENTSTEAIQKTCDTSIKIKTKYIFKDVPVKILLGKTVNGKNLFAKVIKSQTIKNSPSINKQDSKEISDQNKSLDSPKIIYEKVGKHQYINNSGLNESQFLSLVQQSVRGKPQIKHIADDIASAESVIAQLVRAPNLRKSVLGHNLIITKITNSEDESGKLLNRSKPSLITGIVTMTDAENGHFTHLPDLLQKIMAESEKKTNTNDKGCKYGNVANTNINIFHVHIWETKSVDSISQITVTLNKRQLSLDLVLDLNKRHPVAVYACGTCAAIFKSEITLKEHQESQCMDTDDMLTIDTDNKKEVNNYNIVKNGNKNIYVCKICEAKFVRLSNCQKHFKTHSTLSVDNNITEETTLEQNDNIFENKQTNEVFRCKMCPSTYFHSSTLSKHIMARHINAKSK